MSTTQRRRKAGRRRTALLAPSPDYDFEILVDYRKPRTPEALEVRAAINRTETDRILAQAGDLTPERLEVAAREVLADEANDTTTSEAMADLAALCAAAITDVRTDEGSLPWEDYGDRTWRELDEDERERCASENVDLCVWSIAYLISRGANTRRLGESSAPRSTATPRG